VNLIGITFKVVFFKLLETWRSYAGHSLITLLVNVFLNRERYVSITHWLFFSSGLFFRCF